MATHPSLDYRSGRTVRWAVPVLGLIIGMAAAPSAHGQLRICNKVPEAVSIAVAYYADGAWTSWGWFHASTGECVNTVGGPLRNRYYYVRAEGVRGGKWGGEDYFCTRKKIFVIRGDEKCGSRGYSREGFFTVDIGHDAQDWTLNLTYSADSRERRSGMLRLTRHFRESLFDDGTQVLVLKNPNGFDLDFALECHSRNGNSKTLPVSIPAQGYREIGFMQGWSGNFDAGEYCDAYYADDLQWTIAAR